LYTKSEATHVDELLACSGFQWDEGNTEKSWLRHKVSWTECEQVFLNHPLLVVRDEQHSGTEARHFALGKTNAERLLFVVFTIRGDLIRVISARDMSRRERKEYGHAKEEGSQEDSQV
jgi:uncharacterized DUF497 family protein